MELPKRKPNRLADYDYSQPNAYFITICTKNKEQLFWEKVGASIARPEQINLSAYGKIVEEAISETGATSIKDMGKVMGAAKTKAAGRADNKVINDIVKELLK